MQFTQKATAYSEDQNQAQTQAFVLKKQEHRIVHNTQRVQAQ